MPRTRATATPLFVPRTASRAEQRAARAGCAEARRQARRAETATKLRTAAVADPDLQPVYPPAGRPGPASARGGRLRRRPIG